MMDIQPGFDAADDVSDGIPQSTVIRGHWTIEDGGDYVWCTEDHVSND